MGEKMPDFHVTFRDFLHAVNLRHGTDGFTSSPKEGVLRIFSSDLNPRTWVPKSSTLLLDHRSRFYITYTINLLCFLPYAVKCLLDLQQGRCRKYLRTVVYFWKE